MSEMAKIDYNALQNVPEGQPVSTPSPKAPEGPISQSDANKALPNPAPKKELDSERFAALARKERAIVNREQKLKAQSQELVRKEAEMKAFAEAKANKDYSKAAQLLGITYDEWTNFILNGQKPTADLEVKGVKQELEQLKQAQEARDKKAQEAQKLAAEREYNEVLGDFQSEINEYVDGNKDTYELSSLYGDVSKGLIMEVVQQHFDRTKKILSIKEATELVEGYLEGEIDKVVSTKKFQAKATAKPKESQGQVKTETGRSAVSPTLSNTMTSSAPSLVSAKTEADRINRALAALSK